MADKESLETNLRSSESNREIVKLFLIMYAFKLLTTLTRYYPFSQFFTDRRFHANWVGANRIFHRVKVCCSANNNEFIDMIADRDENFYYLAGRLLNETADDIFKDLQKNAQEEGLEILYRGKMEDGSYKFMAPVNQDWLKLLF
ncbi:MAG: hypothetical protein NT141_02695 [candidate division WWE3 bacterium]|nr:hypothetical protein [candidate division WWE3 bacterium]